MYVCCRSYSTQDCSVWHYTTEIINFNMQRKITESLTKHSDSKIKSKQYHEKSKIPFSYMLYAYYVKEPIGELNLKRALVKIQESFLLPSFIFFSTGSDSHFWEFHPSSVILGVFVFFFMLIFCESLALYVKFRGHICLYCIPTCIAQ